MGIDISPYTYKAKLKVVFSAINKSYPSPVTFNLPFNQSQTAFDILLKAPTNQCYNIEYETNPIYGKYVTSICGVKNNKTSSWVFYVNDKKASVGVSFYRIKPNDVIEFRYMNKDTKNVYIRFNSVTLKVTFDAIDKENPDPVYMDYPSNENKTAFDILRAAQSHPCFNFNHAVNPTYGAYITSICGVSNENTLHNYWMFYVNGERAQVGVSSYQISPNDMIQMRYLHMNFNFDIPTYLVTLKVVFALPDKNATKPFYINYPKNENKTAFDVLLAAQSHPCYNFNYTEIPVYGAYITSICGVSNRFATHTYWMFFVNGKEESLGISSYLVKPNDVVELRYLNSTTLFLRYNITVRVVSEAIDRHGFPPVQLSFPREENKTVFDVLLETQSYICFNSNHSVLANESGSVISICGIHENKTAEIFWKLFINENEISDDVRSYGVKPDDVVEMRYVSVAAKSTPAPSCALSSVNNLNHVLPVFICFVFSVLSVFQNQFYV